MTNRGSLPTAILALAASLLALALGLAPDAVGKTFRGASGADVLRGTSGSDLVKGAGGNDRLFGGAGRDRLYGGSGNDRLVGGGGSDRLIGGPGRDRLSCGGNRDTAVAAAGDHITRDCEVVKDASGRRVQRDEGGAAPNSGPAPAGCRYRTKPVLVLGLDGIYEFQNRVVLECENGAGGGGGGGESAPALSPWVSTLTQKLGFWYQYGPPFAALYRFTSDGVNGVFRGTRTTYPTNQLSFGQTLPFSWKVEGDVLVLQFVSGFVDRIQLLGYNAQTDSISRVSQNGGGSTPWHGCGDANFPAFYQQTPQVCP
jgi:RTX calcium-binding nonapeptide repeat (4 copies)